MVNNQIPAVFFVPGKEISMAGAMRTINATGLDFQGYFVTSASSGPAVVVAHD